MVPIDDIDRLEFRNLHYVSRREKTYERELGDPVILLKDDEYYGLKFAYNMRNDLSHLHPQPYDSVCRLFDENEWKFME